MDHAEEEEEGASKQDYLLVRERQYVWCSAVCRLCSCQASRRMDDIYFLKDKRNSDIIICMPVLLVCS